MPRRTKKSPVRRRPRTNRIQKKELVPVIIDVIKIITPLTPLIAALIKILFLYASS